MKDEELRGAYAAHLRARPEPAEGACVSPEALLALVRREGDEASRLAALDHVMACTRCRAEFDLLRAVEGAGAPAGTAASTPARMLARMLARAPAARPARRWAGPVGLALAASLLVTVGVRQYRDPSRARDAAAGADVERGAPDGATDGGAGVTLVAPAAGDVPAGAPLRFVWHAVPGASRYDVEVLGADGAVAVAGATADTVFAPTDAGRLAPGATYRWWVSAAGVDGGAARRSSLRTLRVAPR